MQQGHQVTSSPGSRVIRRRGLAKVVAAGLTVACVLGLQVALDGPAGAAPGRTDSTGFAQPFAGTPRFTRLAPPKLTQQRQLNRPLGQKEADRIAERIGLRKRDVFTAKQYRLFISGRGVGGNLADAELVDASVAILTNTVGRPLISNVNGQPTATVLASYGLYVNTEGLLESPANASAPTRQVNAVIQPGGYLDTWCRANGATKALVRLYASAFTGEAVFGFAAQQQSGTAQLVPNTKGGTSTMVGMSMAPSIWIVNFALIYTLSPALAAKMPAYWEPIPSVVADAILASPSGQVPYSDYAAYLQ